MRELIWGRPLGRRFGISNRACRILTAPATPIITRTISAVGWRTLTCSRTRSCGLRRLTTRASRWKSSSSSSGRRRRRITSATTTPLTLTALTKGRRAGRRRSLEWGRGTERGSKGTWGIWRSSSRSSIRWRRSSFPRRLQAMDPPRASIQTIFGILTVVATVTIDGYLRNRFSRFCSSSSSLKWFSPFSCYIYIYILPVFNFDVVLCAEKELLQPREAANEQQDQYGTARRGN